MNNETLVGWASCPPIVYLITEESAVTFEEFIQWKPECGSYELHDGEIFEMPQVGKHEVKSRSDSFNW